MSRREVHLSAGFDAVLARIATALETIAGIRTKMAEPAVSAALTSGLLNAADLNTDTEALTERIRARKSAPPTVTGPAPKPAVKKPPLNTPERRALVTLEWPAGVSTAGILRRFNALPGLQTNNKQLGIYAAMMCHVRRPAGFDPKTAPDTMVGGADAQLTAQPTPDPELPATAEIAAPPPDPEDAAPRESCQPPPRVQAAPVEVAIAAPSLPRPATISLQAGPRDGGYSPAAMQLRADGLASVSAPVEWATAAQWAERYAPEALEHDDVFAKLAGINAARLGFGLTAFRLVPSRGPAEALPAAAVGGGPRNDYSVGPPAR